MSGGLHPGRLDGTPARLVGQLARGDLRLGQAALADAGTFDDPFVRGDPIPAPPGHMLVTGLAGQESPPPGHTSVNHASDLSRSIMRVFADSIDEAVARRFGRLPDRLFKMQRHPPSRGS